MKLVKTKSDWFYEMRPYLIIGVSILGMVAQKLIFLPSICRITCNVSIYTLLILSALIIFKRRTSGAFISRQ